MEDLLLEDLIANVVDDPAPRRVPCQPATLPSPVPAARSLRSIARAIVRRIIGRQG
jgi:hypothetical protein